MGSILIPNALRLGAARFWRWWSGELLALLPARLRGRLTPASQRLVVDFANGKAHFLRGKGETLKRVGSIFLDDPDMIALPQEVQIKAARKIIDRAGLRGAGGLVRLPRDKVLRRVVDLPAAAAENLREVLGFEMDRQTPFKADEVYFDFRISGQDPQRKRIEVDLVVVPREVVDRAMRLADAWGVDLDRADMGGKTLREDQLFYLLPGAGRAARGRLRRRLIFASAILCVAMFSAAVYLPLQVKNNELIALEVNLARARADAGKVEEIRQQVENLTTQSSYVVELKGKRRTATEVLNEVTRLLPDSTWVLKFSVRNNRLSVSGYSAKPSALIGLLEDSVMFASVRFSSPVTMDRKVGLERFNLTATVAGRDS